MQLLRMTFCLMKTALYRKGSRCYRQVLGCMPYGYIQRSAAINQKTNVVPDESHEQIKKRGYPMNYCLVITAILSTISLCLYNFKKQCSNFLSVAYALDKNDSGYRKHFNFVADVVEQCGNAVVCIENQVYRFGTEVVIPRGSGFIITEDGLILTNAHVVLNKPHSLQIKLKDGRVYNGKVEDIDIETDLATIRIEEKNLPVMKLGSSLDLRAGEWVIAIGSPFALNNSVSTGVVSCPQRKGEDLGLKSNDLYYIQTDATINFGNSGGPLVNLDGEVVGINSMKVVTGISFAVPIEFVKRFLKRNEEQRMKEGDPHLKGNSEKRGYLGVVMLTLSSNLFDELNHKQFRMPDSLRNGIIICEVAHNTPAYRSGLQPGDIISEINGNKVQGVKSVYEALKEGVPLRLKIFRKDTFLNVTVTPDQL